MTYEERYAEELKHNRYAMGLKALGMEMIGETLICNRPHIIARIKTGRRDLTIYFQKNGTARIEKPNGTVKFVCEKTPAQLTMIARQVLEFYK